MRFRPSAHGYVAVPTDRPGGRGSLTGRVDSEGRVRLPPAVAGRLDPDGRGEVYARAVAGRLELYPTGLLDRLIDSLDTSTPAPAVADH